MHPTADRSPLLPIDAVLLALTLGVAVLVRAAPPPSTVDEPTPEAAGLGSLGKVEHGPSPASELPSPIELPPSDSSPSWPGWQ